mmetsp:Transcript_122307/g.273249  ORF Transcript_122307/g.273249 Transcript_122307/m.273249 type:complete len:393 (+) Transcript_122307:16-1194(+)
MAPLGEVLARRRPNAFEDGGGSEVGNAHKKEVAGALALLFALLAVVGGIFCSDPQDLEYAKNWANRDWMESFCAVMDVGVAYRGDCHMDVTLMMTEYRDFHECMGPRETVDDPVEMRDEWDTTAPGRCAVRGDMAYLGRDVTKYHEGATESRGRRRLQDDGGEENSPPRMLIRSFSPNRLVCHNSYLLWALVSLPNTTSAGASGTEERCAYTYGATDPSITGTWSQITSTLKKLKEAEALSGGVRCWVLSNDDCVVSFKDFRLLINQELHEHSLVRMSGVVCGVVATILAAMALRWHCLEKAFGDSEIPAYYHTALPTSEPEPEAMLSDRVRQIMSVAAAHLTETTPTASGESTLCVSERGGSHRTVEVVGPNGTRKTVPRNVAADFMSVTR